MPQFCSLFYAILQSWRPKGLKWQSSSMAQCPPPLNMPLVAAFYFPQKRAFFALFYKTRANTQQVLPVQTNLYRYDE